MSNRHFRFQNLLWFAALKQSAWLRLTLRQTHKSPVTARKHLIPTAININHFAAFVFSFLITCDFFLQTFHLFLSVRLQLEGLLRATANWFVLIDQLDSINAKVFRSFESLLIAPVERQPAKGSLLECISPKFKPQMPSLFCPSRSSHRSS